LIYIPFLAKVIISNDIPLDTFSYPAVSIRSLNGYGNQLTIGNYLLTFSPAMIIGFILIQIIVILKFASDKLREK